LFEAQYLKTIGKNKKIKIAVLTSGYANKNRTKSSLSYKGNIFFYSFETFFQGGICETKKTVRF